MPTSSCASEASALATLIRAVGPVSVVGCVTPASQPLGLALANELGVPLTVVLVQGLVGTDSRRPWGAVDEDGSWVVDYFSVAGLRLDPHDMDATRERGLATLQQAREACPDAPLTSALPAARVVLVQRGLDQGLLMDAAVSQALRRGAEEVVVATPWSTRRAASRFARRDGVTFVCPDAEAPAASSRAVARPDRQLIGW